MSHVPSRPPGVVESIKGQGKRSPPSRSLQRRWGQKRVNPPPRAEFAEGFMALSVISFWLYTYSPGGSVAWLMVQSSQKKGG